MHANVDVGENFFKLCLDCSAGGTAYNNARFGAGTGPIYLDDVGCTSSASQLLECSSRPILTHNCRHSADASVGCKGIIYTVVVQSVHV